MKHTQRISYAFVVCLTVLSLTANTQQKITVPVAAGELMDKITILEIKVERIIDKQKQNNATFELKSLKDTLDETPIVTPKDQAKLEELTQQLLKVNKKLWDIENNIRAKEAEKLFDAEFIEIARSVYLNNRERFAIKRSINKLTGSSIIEEKEYTEY